jgi:O-antigen/teichoic acid export membrane protein
MVPLISFIKKHLNTPLYTNAYYLMSRTAINAVSGFIFWALAARIFGTHEFGAAAAVISAAGLVASFSTLGMGFGIIRFLPGAGEGGPRLINYCLTVAGIVSLVLATGFVLGIGLWSPALADLRHDPFLFFSFLLLAITTSIIPLLDRVFTAQRSGKYAFVMTSLVAVLKVVFVITLMTVAQALAIVASAALATACAVIVSTVLLLPKSQHNYKPVIVVKITQASEMLRYSLGSYGADLLASIPGLLIPLVVVNVLGERSNAYFYAAWTISALITAIPFAITTSLFVEGSYDDTTFNENAKKAIRLSYIILIPVILVVFLAGRFILSIYGNDFGVNASHLLIILACSSLFSVFVMVYLTQRRILKDVKSLALVSFILLVVQVGLSYLLMKYLGINGIGVAVLVSHAVVAIPLVIKWLRPYARKYLTEHYTTGNK